MEVQIVRKELHHSLVRPVDIFRISRERHPAKRALALTEEGADIGRHETRKLKRIGHTVVEGLLPKVVAVVKDLGAGALEGKHGLHVGGHGGHGFFTVGRGVGEAQLIGLLHGEAGGNIHQGFVGGRLVRDHIRRNAAHDQLLIDIGGVPDQTDGIRRPGRLVLLDEGHGLFERIHNGIDVANLATALGALPIDFHNQPDAFIHGYGHGLGTTHASQAGGEHEPALERFPAPLPGKGPERLIGALQDPLSADIDPGTGRHLTVHDEALASQLIEVLPSGPMRHEVGVGNQDARGIRMSLEDDHGFPRLDKKGLVFLKVLERIQNGVERIPGARSLPPAAVDYEILRPLGDLRIEVILNHPIGRFSQPGFAGELRAVWGMNRARARHKGLLIGRKKLPAIISRESISTG